jgi:hypothetical protein
MADEAELRPNELTAVWQAAHRLRAAVIAIPELARQPIQVDFVGGRDLHVVIDGMIVFGPYSVDIDDKAHEQALVDLVLARLRELFPPD